jgi:TonB-dependent starch-binding outer membrane protein SusC
MKRMLQKIPKLMALLWVLSMFPFPVYPQTFARHKELKRSVQKESSSVKLRDLVLELKNQYKVNILFEDKLLNDFVVNDSVMDLNKDIEQNLDALLNQVNLQFQKVKKNSYLILPRLAKIEPTQTQSTVASNSLATPPIEQTQSAAKNVEVAIQITGFIKDENGASLPGVNVIEKGTTNGTTSDTDGKYVLSVQNENSILVFSFIGYIAAERAVGSQTALNVSLVPDIKSLQEVVVIGYGTRDRKDITGSISDIKSSDIVQSNALSPQLAMQGRMTGVLVTGGGGDPNARPNINIRGVTTFGNNTQPLYIVDGIPVAEFGEGTTYSVEGLRAADLRGTQNIFNLINPNDIESISVLKDASSAAVYGVRAANGVVIITTKRGKEGKPTVEFSATYGVRNLRKKLDMLNTKEYTDLYQNQIFKNDLFIGQRDYFKFYDPNNPAYLGNSTTPDWQGALINKNALTANYNLGVSGGTEMGRYNISAGFAQQEGSLKYSEQDRYSFSANTDFKIRKWLEVGETFRLAYTKMSDQRNNTGVANDMIFLLGTPPWQQIYDSSKPDGIANADVSKYGPETGINFVGINQNTSQTFGILRTLGNAYAALIPVEGLRIKGTLSVDRTDNKRTAWSNGVQTTRFNPTNDASGLGNQYGIQNTLNYGITKELSINYTRAFANHHFDVLLNASDQQIYFEGLNAGVSNITLKDPNTYTLNAGLFSTINATEFKESFAVQGYLARLSYKFSNKYYLDATIMRNGSSRFNPDFRWGTFPSVSAAWRISGENFMQSQTIFSDLKLRGGWGQLGNQDTRAFAYISTVNRNAQYTLGNTDNGSGTPGAVAFLGDFANPDLTWEKVTTSNIGLDASLFSNALSVTLEYYSRTTDGILQGVPFPLTAGLTNPPVFNIAKVSNKGIELALNYRHKVGEVDFSIGGNITTVKNEVIELYENQTVYGNNTRIVKGNSINSIYGFQTDGIFQTQQEVTDWLSTTTMPGNTSQLAPGDFRWTDLYAGPDQQGTPDGVINGFDQTYLGKTIPGYYYGITLGASWKSFDLNVLFQGVGDVDKINYVRIQGEYMGGPGNNWLRSTRDHWTPENQSNTMPRPIFSDPSGNGRFSNRWVENGSFLRLNNLQVGYTLPQSLLEKIGGISTVRLFAQSTNTFVFTKYTGLDPENDNNPTPRAFIFGLNASF